MCFRIIKRKSIETKAEISTYVNTIKSIIFGIKFHKIVMNSTMILWYLHEFHKIRTV